MRRTLRRGFFHARFIYRGIVLLSLPGQIVFGRRPGCAAPVFVGTVENGTDRHCFDLAVISIWPSRPENTTVLCWWVALVPGQLFPLMSLLPAGVQLGQAGSAAHGGPQHVHSVIGLWMLISGRLMIWRRHGVWTGGPWRVRRRFSWGLFVASSFNFSFGKTMHPGRAHSRFGCYANGHAD